MGLNTRSSGYGAAVLTLINLFSQIMQFIFRIALTRLIGPEVIGLYQLVLPAHSVIMSIAVSGFTVAVSRLSAQYNANKNTLAIRQLIWQARGAYITVLLVVSALIIPFSDAISVHLMGDARARMGILFLLPVVLLTGWENVQKNFFYGMKQVNPPAVSEILEQVTRVGSVLLLLWLLRPSYAELQVAMIVVGMLISEIASAALLTVFYRRWKERTPASGHRLANTAMLRELGAIALPIAGANLLANILGSANSLIIPGRLVQSGLSVSEALSSFGVAFGMTMPLLGLPTALMGAMAFVTMPRIAEQVALSRWKTAEATVRRTLATTLIILVPGSVILCLFGPGIARALFKQESAGLYMTPMMVATALTCLQYIMGSMLNGMGAQRRSATNLVFSGAVELVITWYACAQPNLRLFGFVLAFLISSFLGAGLNLWDLRSILRQHNSSPLTDT